MSSNTKTKSSKTKTKTVFLALVPNGWGKSNCPEGAVINAFNSVASPRHPAKVVVYEIYGPVDLVNQSGVSPFGGIEWVKGVSVSKVQSGTAQCRDKEVPLPKNQWRRDTTWMFSMMCHDEEVASIDDATDDEGGGK